MARRTTSDRLSRSTRTNSSSTARSSGGNFTDTVVSSPMEDMVILGLPSVKPTVVQICCELCNVRRMGWSMLFGVFSLALVLSGCGGSDEPSGPCTPLEGTYRINTTLRSGTCPQVPEQVTMIHPGDQPATGCETTFYQLSADGCRVDNAITCIDQVTGLVSTVQGVRHNSLDGSSANALIEFTINVPGGFCTGTYDVVYTRL